jgi:Protein of unknown function (DUF3137)
MTFEVFFSQYVDPIYAQSTDQQRYIAAKKHTWQFVWMFLLCVLVGLSLHWFVQDFAATIVVFSLMLLASGIFYVRDYPYPDFEKPGFFTYFFMVLFAGGGCGVLLMSEHATEPLITAIFGAVLLGAMAIIALAQSPHRASLTRPYEQLKTEVIDLFFKHLYPNFGIVSAQPFDKEALRQKNIIDGDFNEIQYGIALHGTLSQFALLMQQVKLIKVTRDSKGKTSRSTVFEGFLLSYPQKNALTAPVILRQHRGFELQDVFWKESHRIEMENPDFETIYDILGPNEFEARRLMTPALMARLTPFAIGENTLSGILFDVHHTFFAVKTRQSFFEENYANQQAVKLELQQIQQALDKQLELVLAVSKT